MKNSFFDGGFFELILRDFLCLLLIIFTLGFGYPWAHCIMLRWEAKHTVIGGKRLKFTGNGWELFGLWFFLAAILYIGAVIVSLLMWSGILTFGLENLPATIFSLALPLFAAGCYRYFAKIQMTKWVVKYMEAESIQKSFDPGIQKQEPLVSPSQTGGTTAAESSITAFLSFWILFIALPAGIAGAVLLFMEMMVPGAILLGIGALLLIVSYFNQ